MSGERRGDQYRVFGPTGRDTQGSLVTPRSQGYTVSEKKLLIPESEWEFGEAAYDKIMRDFNREHPWSFDRTTLADARGNALLKGGKDLSEGSFRARGKADVKYTKLALLKEERLSPVVVQNLKDNWWTESYLSDFGMEGLSSTRFSMGEELLYEMWIGEERHHREIERVILETAGGLKSRELHDQTRLLKEREWVAPYTTRRQMRIYPYIQELTTQETYEVEAKQMINDGAPVSAYAISLVASDEGFHGAGFKMLVMLDYERDPEGTEKDAYYVARHFRMPGDYLFPDQRETFRAYRNGLGITQRWIAKQVHRALIALPFVDPNKALLVAAEYGKTIGDVDEPELNDLLEMPTQELAAKMEVDSRFMVIRENTNKKTLKPKILAA